MSPNVSKCQGNVKGSDMKTGMDTWSLCVCLRFVHACKATMDTNTNKWNIVTVLYFNFIFSYILGIIHRQYKTDNIKRSIKLSHTTQKSNIKTIFTHTDATPGYLSLLSVIHGEMTRHQSMAVWISKRQTNYAHAMMTHHSTFHQ